VYPYAALASLQAPKFISDMVESLLGAVYVDSVGDLGAVRAVMTKLGITQVLERIVESDIEVLHPVSRLAIWAAQQDPQKKIKYDISKADGNVTCAVLVDGTEAVKITERYRSRASQEQVRFAAAEQALQILNVREDEEEEDWGDVPEYDW